ncbi:peptidylprolyl isomerase [Candidatus Palibaumannia cicadellinicola]|uniref:Survival protein SurA (Peptidyl-prolyl cis-trans isomerase) n=1 Tax=Candidatus Palibaumannia cicadellinicola TaxID=186490 RepID=A0A0K2BM26_9GAMM|nr:peptidylprolyl isomerase [Candidatus Baumannia cicadellinicola]AKZ66093.1 Survival protein SurA precursor (Peptidyl-prolyl cis-trans isomerase) [Candidatus Baumannia cicadellinicola]
MHHYIIDNYLIDHVIKHKIVLKNEKKLNFFISDDQLNQIILEIANKNNLSISEFRRFLIKSGISYDTYRTQLRNYLFMTEVCKMAVRSRVNILQNEVESMTNKIIFAKSSNSKEFHLSHIVIPIVDKPSQYKINKAKELAILIMSASNQKEDFSQLAKKYSTKDNILYSHNFFWIKNKELSPIVAEYLTEAQKGSIIGPIYLERGFHIFKVNDIRSKEQKMVLPITEVYASHIVISTSGSKNNDNEKAYYKLRNIAQNIKSGNISFSAAAKQISTDVCSAHQGGDLGWNKLNTFNPIFRGLLLSLKDGELSEPIYFSNGWHLIKLHNKRKVYQLRAQEKEHAYRLLYKRKLSEALKQLIKKQRSSVYVKIIDNN